MLKTRREKLGYKILYKKELCANQFEIRIKAPFITKNAKAGQFIILRTDKNSERIPLTIADYNRETRSEEHTSESSHSAKSRLPSSA